MGENRFEQSRISEGTLQPEAQIPGVTASGVSNDSAAISRDDERDGVIGGEEHGTTHTASPTTGRRRVLAASTLKGDRVRNPAGEDLGSIDQIMIDLPTGRVAYVVLSFGGFLGIGDKLFALPWSAFRIDEGEHEFVLDVDRKSLENAPGFDKDSWPDMADPVFGKAVHEHYGKTPYWEHTVTDAGDYTGDEPPTNRSTEFEPTTTIKPGGGL